MILKRLIPKSETTTSIILFNDPISVSSYGSVYLSEWKSLMSATKISTVKDFIEKEISFYLHFNNEYSFIPKLFGYGEATICSHKVMKRENENAEDEKEEEEEEEEGNTVYYLTMERLGPSIDCLHDEFQNGFSKETFYWFAAESLKRIRDIHSVGILHRDIKPDNFAVDDCFKNTLYIFDFGLSYYYKKENNKNNAKSIIGTLRYASKNSHNNSINESHSVSCKDDLESYLYMMMYLYHNDLPWIKYETITIENINDNNTNNNNGDNGDNDNLQDRKIKEEVNSDKDTKHKKQVLKRYINEKIYHSKVNDVLHLLEMMGPLWSALYTEIEHLDIHATINYNEWITSFENYYSVSLQKKYVCLDWNIQTPAEMPVTTLNNKDDKTNNKSTKIIKNILPLNSNYFSKKKTDTYSFSTSKLKSVKVKNEKKNKNIINIKHNNNIN